MCFINIFVRRSVYQIEVQFVGVQQTLYPYNLGCTLLYKFLCIYNINGFKSIKNECQFHMQIGTHFNFHF